MNNQSLIGNLAALPDAERAALLKGLTEAQAEELLWDWRAWARPNQLAPEGDWLTWVVLAGRGFGKTRCGAEWVREEVMSGRAKRIALVAETQKDLEEVMVFGDSGLESVFPPSERPTITRKPVRIEFKNGALAHGYNATEPNQLRGPQFDLAWCFIAGTMVATPYGDVPIENIKIGDEVLTRDGPKRVVAAKSHVDTVGTVKFADGRKLVGTAEHPVYLTRGWTRLDQLKIGDAACAINASYGAESVGTDTVMRITNERTNQPNQRGPLGFIAKCGSLLRDQFQRALTSITATTTKVTTPWTILSAFREALICACIEKKFQFLKLIGPPDNLQRFLVPYALQVSCESASHLNPFVKSAYFENRTMLGGGKSFANTADKHLQPSLGDFAVNVASTWQPEGAQNVWCLTVEGSPEYFANGILVHNCDELAKWSYARETWDMLQFGMRLGQRPRQIITTTPRPIPVLKEIIGASTTVVTRGSTRDNTINLAPSFIKSVISKYEGTRLGRQELDAEILDDVPGALWNRDSIDQQRKRSAPDMTRVVVAIDPSGTRGDSDDGDSIGIVVAGKGIDGRAYVLADRTCKLSPDGWGRRAISAYHEFKADRIVAERNFGGAMVENVIRTIDSKVSYKEVTASRGKLIRAEPVAALYEQNRVSHIGSLPDLEDQLCHFQSDGYLGEGSPDRADALVWAITELMLEPELLPPTFSTWGM